MGLFETLNRLGVLSVGRRPEWKEPTSTTGAPSSSAAGVALTGAVKTLLHIALREEAHRRTARVSLTFDAATTYRVTVDGNNVDVAADTDEATTLQAIVDAINADATVGAIVTAAVEDGQVVLRGDAEADYTIATSIVSGAGEIVHTADATTCTARVWLLPGGVDGAGKPTAWVQANGGFFEGLDYRGLTERLDTAGFDRAYVELLDADGDVQVRLGPGVME